MRSHSFPRPIRWLALAGFLFVAVELPWQSNARQPEPTPPNTVAVLRGHTESVYAVAFTGDQRYVITASFDTTLKAWEVNGGREYKTFGGPQGHTKNVLSVSISPDGSMLASGSVDNTAKVWDFPTANALRSLAAKDAVDGVALSPDGKMIAGACKDGTVK